MSINMNSKKIKAQFANETNPRVGLIVLSTDNMIEKDFSKVLSDKPVDLYVNRIKNYNPVTAENLKKMSNKNVISVVLPGTTFFLGKSDYVDCNKIIKAGGEIAIATDFNPGSSYMQSMPFIMLLSNLYCKYW